jgi:hypothetical protein
MKWGTRWTCSVSRPGRSTSEKKKRSQPLPIVLSLDGTRRRNKSFCTIRNRIPLPLAGDLISITIDLPWAVEICSPNNNIHDRTLLVRNKRGEFKCRVVENIGTAGTRPSLRALGVTRTAAKICVMPRLTLPLTYLAGQVLQEGLSPLQTLQTAASKRVRLSRKHTAQSICLHVQL